VDYFNDNIGSVKSLDDLMGDRRLLKVALGSFGLGDEIDKGAFVRKVLEEGTEDRSAFAVRLNNPDYLDMARVFDFSSGELALSDTQVSEITKGYQQETFEVALGEVDNSMRLALNFKREIAEIADQGLLSLILISKRSFCLIKPIVFLEVKVLTSSKIPKSLKRLCGVFSCKSKSQMGRRRIHPGLQPCRFYLAVQAAGQYSTYFFPTQGRS